MRQGTVTPTHYNVVYDGSGWKPDILQKLTYKLTHMYYNWPGTIRVPAPCQVSHMYIHIIAGWVPSVPGQSHVHTHHSWLGTIQSHVHTHHSWLGTIRAKSV